MWTNESSVDKKLKSDYDLDSEHEMSINPLLSTQSRRSLPLPTSTKRSSSKRSTTFSIFAILPFPFTSSRFRHLPRNQQYLILFFPICFFLFIIHQLITHDILIIRRNHSTLTSYHYNLLNSNSNFDKQTDLLDLQDQGAHLSDSDPSISSSFTNSISKSLDFKPPNLLDIVISYYDQDLESFSDTLENVRKVLLRNGGYGEDQIRTFVYSKNQKLKPDSLREFLKVDAVVKLDNRGREGGTYLEHIEEEYGYIGDATNGRFGGTVNSRLGGLSQQTLFIQSHLEYPYTALRRLKLLSSKTGFLSLGTYALTRCGQDVRKRPDQNFPDFGRVYQLFRGRECPLEEGEAGEQVMVYRGQFAVSRDRIRSNPKEKYTQLSKWLNTPPDPTDKYPPPSLQMESTPQDPIFGHTLERSWALIFNCAGTRSNQILTSSDPNLNPLEPNLARTCGDGFFSYLSRWKGNQCQCLDRT